MGKHNGDLLGTRLLRVGDVMEKLNMSRTKIYNMMKNGEIPHVRIAGCIRFPENGVNKLIADCYSEKG
jgi:excisionase family DNA binding protein